jgi:hypothetical protein
LLDIAQDMLKIQVQILEQAGLQVEYPAVNNGQLVAQILLLHHGRLYHVDAPLLHVELH